MFDHIDTQNNSFVIIDLGTTEPWIFLKKKPCEGLELVILLHILQKKGLGHHKSLINYDSNP